MHGMMRGVLAGLAACMTAAVPGAESAGANPGLERGASGWHVAAPNFAVRDGAGRNGSKGLVWEGVDTNRYCISSYAVPFRPGQNLRIAIWIRNESLSRGTPGFCVEFFGKDGGYRGGVGSKECPGQHAAPGAWRRYVAETGPIPQGTYRCSVDLSVSKGVTGRCAYDDVEVEAIGETQDALFYSSAPDDRAADGAVRLFAATYADLRAIAPTNLDVHFILDTTTGRRRVKPDAFADGRAELTVDVAALKPGRQRMQFVVATKDGRQLDERRLPFERLAAPIPAKVWFDRHRRMIVDGKPVYPLLVYVSGLAKDDGGRVLKALDAGPIKMIMSYDLYMTPEKLDRYQAHGIRVFTSFCSASCRAWNVPVEIGAWWDEIPFVAARLARLKDHPALLGWYLFDEPTPSEMGRCRERYKFAKALDPCHPVLNVLCHARQSRETLATCDVVGLDCYPVPGSGTEATRPANLAAAAAATREALAGTRGDKPFWFVPQAYPHEPERARFPTVHELRSMTWQSIACGADGVLFYSLGEMLGNREKPGYCFAEAWKTTCAVAQEIADRTEMLLSTEPAPALADVPPTVVARAWRLRGKTMLVAVNLTHRPVACTIRLDGRPVALAFGPDDVLFR